MGRAGEAQEAAVDVEGLNGFLRAAKAVAASGGTDVTLVMGNEAADLDSMAGPLNCEVTCTQWGKGARSSGLGIAVCGDPRVHDLL
jgi:hypothetical protein